MLKFALGQRKSSFVSGNRSGEKFFITYLPAEVNVYGNIFFFFQKNTQTSKKISIFQIYSYEFMFYFSSKNKK